MSIKDALKLPAFRIAFVTSFMFGLAILGPRLSIIPLFVVEELKGSNSLVGFVYTLAAFIQGTFLMRAGRLSDHRGRRFVLKMGSSITWLGMAMFLFAGHKSVFIIAMMVIGFGTAFLSTTPSAIVADVITGKSGKVIGFFQMAGDAGMIVGPILSGFLADAYSFEVAFAATLVIYSITVLLAWRLPETLVATED
jgi:MFS family permease